MASEESNCRSRSVSAPHVLHPVRASSRRILSHPVSRLRSHVCVAHASCTASAQLVRPFRAPRPVCVSCLPLLILVRTMSIPSSLPHVCIPFRLCNTLPSCLQPLPCTRVLVSYVSHSLYPVSFYAQDLVFPKYFGRQKMRGRSGRAGGP